MFKLALPPKFIKAEFILYLEITVAAHVRLYTGLYTHSCKYCVHVSFILHIHICAATNIYSLLKSSTCIDVCVFVFEYVCVYMCVYVRACMCACMCVCL